jgi:hypothetical protein
MFRKQKGRVETFIFAQRNSRIHKKFIKPPPLKDQSWWVSPVIPASWEVETKRIKRMEA